MSKRLPLPCTLTDTDVEACLRFAGAMACLARALRGARTYNIHPKTKVIIAGASRGGSPAIPHTKSRVMIERCTS
jgi:hypothetical protein